MPESFEDRLSKARIDLDSNLRNDAAREKRVRRNEVEIETLMERLGAAEEALQNVEDKQKDAGPIGPGPDIDSSGVNTSTLRYSGGGKTMNIKQLIELPFQMSFTWDEGVLTSTDHVKFLGFWPILQLDRLILRWYGSWSTLSPHRYQIFQAFPDWYRDGRLAGRTGQSTIIAEGTIDGSAIITGDKSMQIGLDMRITEEPQAIYINIIPGLVGGWTGDAYIDGTVLGAKGYIPTNETLRSSEIALIQRGRMR